MTQIIIGIDCATAEKNIGLALGIIEDQRLKLRETVQGGQGRAVVDIIADWLSSRQPALLALDAPLGWPAAMGTELHYHRAGMPLETHPDELFSRLTDRVVKEKLGKRPLEVGANLIARTAHAALGLLQELRQKTRLAIPLAWDPKAMAMTSAIEVYPAATMLAHEIEIPNYKKLRDRSARMQLVEALAYRLEIGTAPERLVINSHTIDAAMCVLAGYDFLSGDCIPPTDLELAHTEGWIWIRRPKT